MGNNNKKQNNMKFVKFSVFALALGFFAVSCNNETPAETATTEDTTTVVAPPVEPVAPVAVDTTVVTTPSTDTIVTTTEVKH
jgi:hypothetical protein